MARALGRGNRAPTAERAARRCRRSRRSRRALGDLPHERRGARGARGDRRARARRSGRRGGRRRRACSRTRASAPRARCGRRCGRVRQRDRRDRPHEPRPRAAGGRRASRPSRARRTGYSNLEYDLEAGERGSRQAHVEALLRELTGAEAALAVNNCAAAVLLARGRAGRRAASSSSRAGSSSRSAARSAIPDVVAQSGARLRRGRHDQPHAARRLRARDRPGHRRASCARTSRTSARVGFVEEVEIEELCALGRAGDRRRRARARWPRACPSWPTSRRCAARWRPARALVCFSGDKLLGGPQAGLMVGHARRRSSAAARTRSRARCGSTSSRWPRSRRRCASTATRRGALREIPVLRMLAAGEAELRGARRARCARARGGGRRRAGDRARPRGSAAARCRCSSSRGRCARSTRRRSALDELARAAARAATRRWSAARARAGCCSTRARSTTPRRDAAADAVVVPRRLRSRWPPRERRRSPSAPPGTSITARPR